MICGLLGRKLGHSYSPAIHKHLADYEFRLFEKEPEELEAFLKEGPATGLSVTMPYKQTVIPYLDELTPEARKLGAVNAIVGRPDGSLAGHNTDYFGFQTLVRLSGLKVRGKKALVLGTGGAGRVCTAVLQELGAAVTVISRSGENNYDNLQLHGDAAILVNATPVGMYPNTGVSPVDLDLFPKLEGVLDVIYNPARTQLLLDAESRDILAMNGLWMVVAQAKAGAEWFTGRSIPDSEIRRIYSIMKRQTENIVLIGMPGCGKSAVGREVALRLGRSFVDTDTRIEELAGCSIPEILEKHGVAHFRQLESQVLQEVGKCSGAVISTGGGCVTQRKNYDHLHQNGHIFWLQRDLGKLDVQGRPLSANLVQLYLTREPMYRRFADSSIYNNGRMDYAVKRILEAYL